MGRRVPLTCLSDLKRIGEGGLRAEMDLQEAGLVNTRFLKTFWKLAVKVGGPEWRGAQRGCVPQAYQQ